MKEQYKKFGINMLPERAQFEPGADGSKGGNSVEAGVSLMLERFQARSLRVFSHLDEWFAEFRLFHRKDGVIVKEDDDILSATRYGVMMLRKAKTLHEIGKVAQQKANRTSINFVPAFQAFDPTVAY